VRASGEGKKKKSITHVMLFFFLVPEAGIEPALPKEQDFESSASTSSATRASFGLVPLFIGTAAKIGNKINLASVR
jgi:hypothetical protein